MDWLELGYWGLLLAGFLAGTIIPFSSEVTLAAMLYAGGDPLLSIVASTIGNWAGGMTTWHIGQLGNWHWIEKYFRIEEEKVRAYQQRIAKHGAFLAILGWLPIAGNAILLALGFFQARWPAVGFWMLIGKVGRYVVIYWTVAGVV